MFCLNYIRVSKKELFAVSDSGVVRSPYLLWFLCCPILPCWISSDLNMFGSGDFGIIFFSVYTFPQSWAPIKYQACRPPVSRASSQRTGKVIRLERRSKVEGKKQRTMQAKPLLLKGDTLMWLADASFQAQFRLGAVATRAIDPVGCSRAELTAVQTQWR